MPETGPSVDHDSNSTIARLLDKSVKALALAGGYVLIALMLLTVVAVVSRKVLNAPIIGIQDISEVSLVLVVFSGMAYAGWTGGHIAVDLIVDWLSTPVLRVIDTLTRLAGAALCALLSWQSALRAIEAREFEEATNLISIKLFPFFWVIAAGFGLFALALFVLALRAARHTPDYPEP